MTGVIDDLWRYPFKGARGHRPEFLTIDPTVGVMEDRRYAIRRIIDLCVEYPSEQFKHYAADSLPS
jgi:uncharacterized protein YcbX